MKRISKKQLVKELEERFGGEFSLADELVRLGYRLFAKPFPHKELFGDVLLACAVKAHKSLESLTILAKRGFGEDASVITRTIIELAINILYIAQDPRPRTQRYVDWEPIRKEWLWRQMEAYHPQVSKKYFAERKRVLDLYRKVAKNFREDKKKGNWSGITLAEMAAEVQMSWHVHVLYAHLSNLSHSNVVGVKPYIKEASGGRLAVLVGPSPDWVGEAIPAALEAVLRVFGLVNELWNLKLEQELNSIADRYVALREHQP
ncbi:MAG: DUF5677 domain-containing protein [Bacillota bacterium]